MRWLLPLLLLLSGCVLPEEPSEDTPEAEEAPGWCEVLCEAHVDECGAEWSVCVAEWDARDYSWFQCNDLLDYPINCDDPTQPGEW